MKKNKIIKLLLLSFIMITILGITATNVLADTSLCVGGTSFSNYAYGSGAAAYVFQNNTSNYWEGYISSAGNPNGSSIGYQFASPVIINSLNIWQGHWENIFNYKYESTNITVQGSNDGYSYNDIVTLTPTAYTSLQEQSFSFANSSAYYYYRLRTNMGYAGNGWCVDELQMMGSTYYTVTGITTTPSSESLAIGGTSQLTNCGVSI